MSPSCLLHNLFHRVIHFIPHAILTYYVLSPFLGTAPGSVEASTGGKFSEVFFLGYKKGDDGLLDSALNLSAMKESGKKL